MYLKRMELQGFKSFAAKTMFEFGPGITAVVGPNGSGKSNVAESIRWVLGEQSARNVRARRLEDIIFSGSSQKAAVGMAEVSITMDNSEGWLPVDYAEVVVTRRAFRSGESEYLINRNKVRLRDVMDLFMRARVGQNSYAFMSQGLVDEVLVMRPDDRRRLLEEAADVRILRARLDEARDRLAATRENLERVNLLLDEIGPRLTQLERQATRAIEHGKLARELHDTLRELYTRQWTIAQAALVSARTAFETREQQLDVAQQEAKACEDGLATLSPAVEEREKDLAARRARHRSLSDQVHALEQRLALDKERREGQSRRRVEIETELASLREERSDLQRSITADHERALTVVPEIEDARSLIATRRQELNTLEQEQASLRRRIADSEDIVNRARRGINEADAALKRLSDEEARAQGETSRRASRKREIIDQFLSVRREARDLRDLLWGLDRDINDAEQERIGLSSMVESSRNDLRALENENLALETNLNQLRAREDLLRRLQNAQEGVDAGARFLLGDENTSDSVTEGLIGLVRDIVRVPPGLERAIEAGLAENLQALVFENLPVALAALEMLEQREQGRALVYPIDLIKPAPPLNILREKGVIGVAARLVRCENRFRPLVDALLGRVIVVESVAFAQQVLKRGLGSVVTMDGYHLRVNGSISGGVAKAASESFSRQRELDELPEQIANLASHVETMGYRLLRERESLEGSSRALSQVEPALQKLRDERNRRQNALSGLTGRQIVIRSEVRTLRQELRRGDQDTDWRGRRARFVQERERLEAEVKEADAALARDRQALQAVAGHRNRAIEAVSEAAAAQADLEGEARSLTRQVEMVQASLQRVEQRIKGREDSLKAIDAELRELGQRDDGEAVGLEAQREELDTLTRDLEPAEGELAHLAARERTMRDQLATARTRLLEAERHFLETDSALKLRGEELEALRELILAEGFQIQGSGIAAAPAPAPAPQPEEQVAEQTGLPPIRGAADVDVETLRARVTSLRNRIRQLGPVNEQAQADYGESKERFDFLKGQVDDLQGSEQTLLVAIDELEGNIRERLTETFIQVDAQFRKNFESFFNGGNAKLVLTNVDDMANTGIDISAQPPGKRVNTLAMLSGGERTLTSLALLMALLEANPSPVCVLDEVDAALDETNVGRFVEGIKTMAQRTQFIIVTHNPRTVEAADAIYGVSMGADSTSRILSVKLSDPPPQSNS